MFTVYSIVTQPAGFIAGEALSLQAFWWMAFIAFYAFPDVVNVGFTRKWNPMALRGGLIGLALLAAAAGWLLLGSPISMPLGALTTLWLLYVFVHLGASFLLAAVLGTPGCEMRSIPQLIAILSGRASMEHYCPGIMTPLDRWEAAQRGV